MCFKKNKPKTRPEEELNDIVPVSDEKLGGISGAGNPWGEVTGVPEEPIDEEVREKG